MVRSAWIAAVIGFVLALAAPAAAGERELLQASRLESSVLVEVNAVRAKHGRTPLRLSSKLSAAARAHSHAMARKGFFAHESADGTRMDQRVRRYYTPRGFRSWSVGENLVWRSPDIDAAAAVQMWMGSPPHRANLLHPAWREIGLGAIHAVSAPGAFGGLEVTILTADFGVRR